MGKLFLVPRFFFEQLGFEILWNQLMGPRNVLDWQLATIPASLNEKMGNSHDSKRPCKG